LREPPRIITTRMTANSSTTDREMATTDHTLAVTRLTRPGPPAPAHRISTIVPPTTHSEEVGDTRSAPVSSHSGNHSTGGARVTRLTSWLCAFEMLVGAAAVTPSDTVVAGCTQ
jgi:hypothetical protein